MLCLHAFSMFCRVKVGKICNVSYWVIFIAAFFFAVQQKKAARFSDSLSIHMAGMGRFELPTNWFVASYSIQLSYIPERTLYVA